jgi:hypothetical protein
MAGLRDANVRFVVLYPRDVSVALRTMVEAQLPLVPLGDDGRRLLFAVDLGRPCPVAH